MSCRKTNSLPWCPDVLSLAPQRPTVCIPNPAFQLRTHCLRMPVGKPALEGGISWWRPLWPDFPQGELSKNVLENIRSYPSCLSIHSAGALCNWSFGCIRLPNSRLQVPFLLLMFILFSHPPDIHVNYVQVSWNDPEQSGMIQSGILAQLVTWKGYKCELSVCSCSVMDSRKQIRSHCITEMQNHVLREKLQANHASSLTDVSHLA